MAGTGGGLCYLNCSDGVSFSTWSQTCGSWNLPKFLFNYGSLTLMYMTSLMFLVSPCASLSTMVKHSGLTGCPVVDVCKCVGEGALRCSLYLSPSVLPDSPRHRVGVGGSLEGLSFKLFHEQVDYEGADG